MKPFNKFAPSNVGSPARFVILVIIPSIYGINVAAYAFGAFFGRLRLHFD